MNREMVIGSLLFLAGQALVWMQTNSQLVWEWWKDKPITAALVYSVPITLAFWYGTRYAMQSTPELWTARFTAAVISYLTFPLMTWFYLGESMFTIKTMLCVLLAFMILIVQIFF